VAANCFSPSTSGGPAAPPSQGEPPAYISQELLLLGRSDENNETIEKSDRREQSKNRLLAAIAFFSISSRG
jgi:hypothetical protein